MTDAHLIHHLSGPGNPPFRDRYDVVVVGARVAGASTALLLARRGWSVLCIDRARPGSDTMSTHSIALPGVLQLSRWGVLGAIRDAGTPATTRVVFDYDGERVSIDLPRRGDVDGLYNPRRTVLDPALVDAAIDAGADVRYGVSLAELTRDRSGRVDGVVAETGGDRFHVRTRFVVGADGARSRVAEQAGAELVHREPLGAASIYAYFEGLPSDTIVNHYVADGVAGVIPTNDGAAVVWAGMPSAQFAASGRRDVAGTHAAQLARVPDLADRLRRCERIGGFRSFPGTPGFLRRAWGAGWALVGDAGYFKDPVSAHGITDALIGAELLADALHEGLAGGDERAALASMEAVRDAMAAEMMPAVVAAAALPRDMDRLQRAFRRMSRAMRDEWALIESRFGMLAGV